MIDEIARYSDADLAEFKELIIKKIQKEHHKSRGNTNAPTSGLKKKKEKL